MRVQNRAMAGVTLRTLSGAEAKGDALGIFEMSEKDATFLLDTGGWELAPESLATPPVVKEEEPPEDNKLPPPPAPSILNASETPPMEETPEPEDSADSAEPNEGEELDLNTKGYEELLKIAEEYGAKVDKRWGEERLREELAKQLFTEPPK